MKNTLTILLLLGSTCLAAQTTIVPFNSVWKYLDNGIVVYHQGSEVCATPCADVRDNSLV